jgi:hypothetical protein
VCCRAKAGGAIVAMTCSGVIGSITRVCSAAVATRVDQEMFWVHVVLLICLRRVCVVLRVGLRSHWVGFPTMCSPACWCLCWCCDDADSVGCASLMACVLAIRPSVLTLSNQLRGGLPGSLAMCVSSSGALPMVCFDSQC